MVRSMVGGLSRPGAARSPSTTLARALAARDRRAWPRARAGARPHARARRLPARFGRGARIGATAAMSLQDLLEVVPAGTGEEDLLRAIDFDAAAAPRRDHHGRQRALGAAAAEAPRRGPPRRDRRGARHGRDRGPPRARGAHALRLLDRELEAAGERGLDADGPAQALPAQRARHAAAATTSASGSSGRGQELDAGRPGASSSARSERTATNTGLQFNIALNYGGRAEIIDAVRRLVRRGPGATGATPTSIDEADARRATSTPPASPTPTC